VAIKKQEAKVIPCPTGLTYTSEATTDQEEFTKVIWTRSKDGQTSTLRDQLQELKQELGQEAILIVKAQVDLEVV
jgi:predicted mannosyl-3-phosphoglycerate phosphatase (HAD superfamily)